jgi:hypothetical protein
MGLSPDAEDMLCRDCWSQADQLFATPLQPCRLANLLRRLDLLGAKPGLQQMV